MRVGKGATIGAGSVVEQASIVAGLIEPNCLYAGVPARKLRENIAWSRDGAYEGIPEKFR